MSRIQIIDSPSNLLLNLLLRETNNWYYLNIVPQYDEALAAYMQVEPEAGFIRFDLKQADTIIYFPLVYYSLTGMHVFGNRPGYRKAEWDEVTVLDVLPSLELLLSDNYRPFNSDDLPVLLNKIEREYAGFVVNKRVLLAKESGGIAVENPAEGTPITVNVGLCTLPTRDYLQEYNSGLQTELSQLIIKFAKHKELPLADAAAIWVKRYSYELMLPVFENYFDKGIVLSSDLYATVFLTDTVGTPIKFLYEGLAIGQMVKPLVDHIGNVEDYWLVQLFHHHLYPLIRNIARFGWTDENNLLLCLSDTVVKLQSKWSKSLHFFDNIHTKMEVFLADLIGLSEEWDFQSKKIHCHNHLINTSFFSKELLQPSSGTVVYKRYFNEGTTEISLRSFDVQCDVETVHHWVNQEYSKKFWEMDGPIRDLERAYIKHLGVHYSHPYIGMLNGEPLFTIELYWAIKDEVGKYYPFDPGDYGFHLLMAPAKQRIPRFSFHALSMCIAYFFSFPQVHRIIGEASVEHLGTHNLITKVGCEFNSALVLPYKTSNLTFLNRALFQATWDELEDVSRTEISVNL